MLAFLLFLQETLFWSRNSVFLGCFGGKEVYFIFFVHLVCI